jgi:hypothetical protein
VRRLLTIAALLLWSTLLFVRLASARGPTPPAESLLYDLRKIVEVQTSAEWKIDRYEYEEMMPDALMSVCSTTVETRRVALAQAGRELARRDVPLKEQLFATRVEHLLAEAMRRAPAECSPWVEPQRDFKARQAGVDRFILSVEGGGAAMVQYARKHPDGTTGLRGAGGGGGRLLLGGGFGPHWSLRVGPEINVNMLARRQGNTAKLPLQYQGALPIVVRYTAVTWHYNLEVAPLIMVTNTDLEPRYGGRVGLLVGVSRLKTRRIIPWAGLGLTAELFPAMNGHGTLLNLKGGLRVGFDWDVRRG